jgi:hypothetical protein
LVIANQSINTDWLAATRFMPDVGRWGILMANSHTSRNLSIFIDQDAKVVYNFVCVPENFSRWASGLGKSLQKIDGEWVAETSEGPVKVKFTERNEFGVLDHWVSPKPGLLIYIPMRVIANVNGCELTFTLFRLPNMNDEKFSADAEWVMRDLTTLKYLLEAL